MVNRFPSLAFSFSCCRKCAGCKLLIGPGRFLSSMGDVWHPGCFRCHVCNLPIADNEVLNSSGTTATYLFHRS